MEEKEKVMNDANLDGNDGAFSIKEEKTTKKGWWKRKSAGQKTTFIISLVILAISLSIFFIWIYSRQLFGDQVGDTLLGFYYNDFGEKVFYNNGWEKIGDLLVKGATSLVLSLFVIAITITIVFILTFFIFIFTNHKSRKSETLGSLLKSLVKYIAILVDTGIILTIFGVDVAGVVAGVGVLTLIIGLGCQSLIQDVISGLFIVFDDYFAVGDIVIVDGFRGTVTEVGLKTTKIQDAGGNIKSISNSQIVTVANLSRYDTMITVSIGVSYEEDIIRVEGIMHEAMPEFAKKIPNITKGPFYKGIDKVSPSSIDFMVLCYSKEADRFQVVRDLNKELVLLLREHNILIPYQQIVVNQPEQRVVEHANEKDIINSKKATEELRTKPVEVKEAKKKRKIKDKVDKALEQASKETGLR